LYTLTNKKDGFTTGYDKDVLELINKITDTNFQLVTGTWKEMLEKAINKEIDGLSTSVVYKEREKYFNFSDTYYTST
jgi:ABC-type amino acid transport substrate-binding protein